MQNKEFILLLGGIIGIIFHFRSLSKDFHSRIDKVNDRIDNLAQTMDTLINNLAQTMNTRINNLAQTMDTRIDSLYNLLTAQNKSS